MIFCHPPAPCRHPNPAGTEGQGQLGLAHTWEQGAAQTGTKAGISPRKDCRS